jgi:hypothetical protein
MHGGRIWAETSNGKENKLCFTVPKLDIRQDVSVGAAPANQINPLEGSLKKQ